MSVELWKVIFDWATVVLIAFTVLSGAGALMTGDILSKRQEVKLHEFQKALGEQQERAAKAERELLELKEHGTPRTLSKEQFDALQELRGKIKAINIAAETDAESQWLASQLVVALQAAGIEVRSYDRGAAVHSTAGIMLYDAYMFENPQGKPTAGEPLSSALKSAGLEPASLLGRMPLDIGAPIDVPMIIVGGKSFFHATSPYLGPPTHK